MTKKIFAKILFFVLPMSFVFALGISPHIAMASYCTSWRRPCPRGYVWTGAYCAELCADKYTDCDCRHAPVRCPCGWMNCDKVMDCETHGACSTGESNPCCTSSCSGKTCGSDGCGGSCGTCPSGKSCTASGTCCTPSCTGKTCGSDGCGGSCGTCPAGKSCTASGKCSVTTIQICTPSPCPAYTEVMQVKCPGIGTPVRIAGVQGGSSPQKIRKSGSIYGVETVAPVPVNPLASCVHVNIPSAGGERVLRKCDPSVTTECI